MQTEAKPNHSKWSGSLLISSIPFALIQRSSKLPVFATVLQQNQSKDNASMKFEKHDAVYQKLKQTNTGLIQCEYVSHHSHLSEKSNKTLSFDIELLV